MVREIDPIEVVATLKGFEQRLIRHSKDNEVTESAFSILSLQRKSGSHAGGYKGKKSWKNKEKKIFVKQNEKNNVYGKKIPEIRRVAGYVVICTLENVSSRASYNVISVTNLSILPRAGRAKQYSKCTIDSKCINHITSYEPLLINVDRNCQQGLKWEMVKLCKLLQKEHGKLKLGMLLGTLMR